MQSPLFQSKGQVMGPAAAGTVGTEGKGALRKERAREREADGGCEPRPLSSPPRPGALKVMPLPCPRGQSSRVPLTESPPLGKKQSLGRAALPAAMGPGGRARRLRTACCGGVPRAGRTRWGSPAVPGGGEWGERGWEPAKAKPTTAQQFPEGGSAPHCRERASRVFTASRVPRLDPCLLFVTRSTLASCTPPTSLSLRIQRSPGPRERDQPPPQPWTTFSACPAQLEGPSGPGAPHILLKQPLLRLPVGTDGLSEVSFLLQ